MEYGVFKALQGLLFFGAAFGFGIWQLIALKRSAPEESVGTRAAESDDDAGVPGAAER